MIDLLSIDIDKIHRPFGNKNLKENTKTGIVRLKQLSDKVQLYPDANHIIVTSSDNGTRINIRCSPLKPLQGHNVFGTDHVIGLGYKLIQFVLDNLGIVASASELRAWERGEYKLREIHLTYHFGLPSHALLKPLVTHILRTIHVQYRPAFIKTGVGITLQSPTPHVEWMLYDKLQWMKDMRHKEYGRLLALVCDEKTADDIWQHLLKAAASALRMELRLFEQYLKTNGLDEPAKWPKGKPREIFLKELASLRLGKVPALESVLPLLNALRDDQRLRQTFRLWMIGDDIQTYCSASTARSHRRRIEELTGIDILLDRPPLQSQFDLAALFHQENIVPKHPDWIEQYPQAYYQGGGLEDVRLLSPYCASSC